MKILITGVAGFIGFHTALRLSKENHEIIGIDNINNYYDPGLKLARLQELASFNNLKFIKLDITDQKSLANLFCEEQPQRVIHLAAQAGVRYSLTDPHAYINANLIGFANMLENCRHHAIEHLVFASSSSVYGANETYPFSESHPTDHPVALYGATKKANELMAHSYAHLFRLPCTGLRFFTVYGPWGRPDMALFKYTERLLRHEPIDVYNHGDMARDFTYIDDIVEGVIRAVENVAEARTWNGADLGVSHAPFRIYNIGNGNPVKLLDFIAVLEQKLGKKAILNLLPMQAGDVAHTHADTSALQDELGYRPKIGIKEGISRFVDWYCNYYNNWGASRS